MDHKFTRTQFLPIPVKDAWVFFSNPRNLPRITPGTLGFKIITDPPDKIYNGLIVEYRVKPLLGIPVKWVSEIKDVSAPYQFVDEQLKGPYAYWHHLHQFKEVFGGTEMVDTVTYRVPFQKYFPWINTAIVEKQLNQIFEFRRQTLEILYGK
ncbi:MAG: SRPBCC family protein [Candidatus Omnitrophica bacterium]|nr:SRPBCC family protein [Candidatus Omnitrophota bacterium]